MRARAFTLIELLVVISIIALLASVVLASLNGAREKGRLGAGKYFAAQADHAANDSAIGMWDFNECTSTIAYDGSGNGNNGILTNGPTWSPDVPVGAACSLSFSGLDTVVEVNGAPSLDKTGALTIAAWVKFPPGISSFHTITIRGNTANIVPWAHFYYDGSSKFILWNANGNAAASSNSVSVEDGKWHHIAVSASTGQKIYFYLDGVDVTPSSGNSTYSETASGLMGYPFEIGARTHTSGIIHDLVGSLDAVRVYSKALTASDVQRVYAEGLQIHTFADNVQ